VLIPELTSEVKKTANAVLSMGGATVVSPGGLGIVVQQRFVAGETLIVEWNHGFLIGTVRHSRPGRDGWVTGIQLESVRSQRSLIAEMVTSERKARVRQLL
jgi:hypothetical protein